MFSHIFKGISAAVHAQILTCINKCDYVFPYIHVYLKQGYLSLLYEVW